MPPPPAAAARRRCLRLDLPSRRLSPRPPTQALASHRILSAPVVPSSAAALAAAAAPAPPAAPLPEGSIHPRALGPAARGMAAFIDIHDVLTSFLQELDMEVLAGAKMLKRMRVLEAEGVKFAAKPLRELQTAGCDGSFFDASAAGATLRAVVREGFLHPGAPAGAGIAASPASSSSKGARAARPVVHRLALLAENGAGIAAVVTQSDVVAFLHARVAALGPLADASVARLGLVAGAERLISVPPETAALDAMALMDARGISAVAVVAAADGRILGNFSVSELRSIVAEHFGSLALPVGEFLALEHGTEYAGYMSQPAAEAATPAAAGFLAARRASLGRKSSSGARPAGGTQRASMDGLAPSASMGRRASAGAAAAAPGAEVGQALVTCGPGATLREVLALLVERRLHRLYVVDAALRPVGVITLTDILRRLADEP